MTKENPVFLQYLYNCCSVNMRAVNKATTYHCCYCLIVECRNFLMTTIIIVYNCLLYSTNDTFRFYIHHCGTYIPQW